MFTKIEYFHNISGKQIKYDDLRLFGFYLTLET